MSDREMTAKEALEYLPKVRYGYNTPNFIKGSYTARRWFSAVEKALQECEERSKGCSFCNRGNIPAKFCPECGRKLKGADNEV